MEKLIEWLEPSIANKTTILIDSIDEDENFKTFMSILQSDSSMSMEIAMELENLFLLYSRNLIDSSYRSGFNDCLNLK